MVNIDVFQEKLFNRVQIKLTGHIEMHLTQTHFEYLHDKTGISVRKLKELFGIYNSRSETSHEYTFSKLAQYLGFENWNDFVKNELRKNKNDLTLPESKKDVHINKKVHFNPKTENKVVISIVIKGR